MSPAIRRWPVRAEVTRKPGRPFLGINTRRPHRATAGSVGDRDGRGGDPTARRLRRRNDPNSSHPRTKGVLSRADTVLGNLTRRGTGHRIAIVWVDPRLWARSTKGRLAVGAACPWPHRDRVASSATTTVTASPPSQARRTTAIDPRGIPSRHRVPAIPGISGPEDSETTSSPQRSARVGSQAVRGSELFQRHLLEIPLAGTLLRGLLTQRWGLM